LQIYLFKKNKNYDSIFKLDLKMEGKMSANIPGTRDLLIQSYIDVTQRNGLIEFTKKVWGPDKDQKGKYSIKQQDLDNLFSDSVWKIEKKPGGHRKLSHKVTNIVVEYKAHDNRNNMDPGAVIKILDQVQKHLNILCDDIFAYSSENWKDEPDYDASVIRAEEKYPQLKAD